MALFNEDKEEVEGALTPEEVEEKIEEAKTVAQEETKEKVEGLEGELEDNKNLLTEAEEELEKEKGKTKNFGKVRGKVDDKQKEVDDLKEKLGNIEGQVTEIRKNSETGTIKQTADKLAKGDEELSKKISHFYNQLAVPEKDTEELKTERFKNAVTLATGGQAGIGNEAIGSGGGNPPIDKEDKEELSEGAKDLGRKMGVKEEVLNQKPKK